MTRMLLQSRQNPWEFSACIPDGAKGVGCFSVKQTFTLGTGTGGSTCGIYVNTDPTNFYISDNLNTTALPVIAANWSLPAQYTSIKALYGKYRPISAGIRATYVGSTISDQGIIVGGLVNGGVSASSFAGKTSDQWAALTKDYLASPLRNGLEITWAPDDIEDTAQFLYITGSAASNNFTPNPPYMALQVYGCNAATPGILMVDVVVNYEGQFSSQTFLPGGLTAPAPAEPGWFERIQNVMVDYPNVLPAIGQALSGAVAAKLQGGSLLAGMANGYLGSRVMDKTGLPRKALKYEL